MAWISTVTAKGLELMQAWITGGGVLTVTGAKGGTEAVDESVLYAQEAVSGNVHALTLADIRQETASSGTVLRANVRVLPEPSSWAMTQIGLYAKLMNGNTQVIGETLVALYQVASCGIVVPSRYTMQAYMYELSMALRVGTGSPLALEVDPEAYVSEDDLDDTLSTLHPKQARVVEMLFTDTIYGRYGICEWKNPGATWTAGRRILGVTGSTHVFTAPADKYACAIKVSGVTAQSMVMESWIETGEAVSAPDASSGSIANPDAQGSGPEEEEIIEEEVIEEPVDEPGDDVTPSGQVKSTIEYETLDGGWMLLTSDQKPTGTVKLGMIILI